MKLKYTFEFVDMGEETIAVPVGPGADELLGILKLNKEAYAIMNKLSDGISIDDIINEIVEQYGLECNAARKYVESLLKQLDDLELLEW